MVKKVLAICDREEEYLYHMADYLEKKECFPFMVRAFTDTSQLIKFLDKDHVELLLIAENAYDESVKGKVSGQVLLLNESGHEVEGVTENINKYQSSETIFRAVMNTYMGEGREIPRRIARGNKMKIIGNYSPIGRCLQTTFALSMGQILAKKHKTLYLNFESYSGFGHLLHREFEADIMDALYYFNGEKEKLAYKLDGLMESINGLDYIPPVLAYKNLQEITGEQWIELFREIERISDYEYLILDLSEQMNGLFDVLHECDQVFTIIKEDGIAEAKLRQYEALLQSMNYEAIAAKTKKWNPPIFHRLPSNMEQLTHGELATYVKKMIEEDIYGKRAGA